MNATSTLAGSPTARKMTDMNRDHWTMNDVIATGLEVIEEVTSPDNARETLDRFGDWTQTEKLFAHDFLEPRLEEGKSIAWWAQPTFRLPFCTYTPDFAELMNDGCIIFWEVKGSRRLPSADRSSLAGRALLYFLASATNVVVRRANKRKKRTKDGRLWTIKEVLIEREDPPIPKEVANS